MGQGNLYEIYAKDVYQGEMYGFVILDDLLFDENTTLVVDPTEEKLKHDFEGVKQTIIPMHTIIRIDEVEKRGPGKMVELGDNVTRFPSSVYTPGSDKS